MIGNNSCGVHSVMAEFFGPGPLTVDQVVALDIVTYDGHRMTVGATSEDELERIVATDDPRGRIYRDLRDLRDHHEHAIRTGYPDIPRRVSGFNLDRLLPEYGFDVAQALVGTEGTCVVVLHATLRLIDAMPARTLVVLGYPDAHAAADQVPQVRDHRPVGLEGIDAKLVEFMRKKGLHPADVDLLPPGDAFLLVEFGADTKAQADDRASSLVDELERGESSPTTKVFRDHWEEQKLWQVRESGLGATAPCQACPKVIRAGRTQQSRPNAWAITFATSAPCSTSSDMTPRSTGTSDRAASTAASTSSSTRCTGSDSGARSSNGPPNSSCRTGDRCPASTETVKRAPRSSPPCTARNWSVPSLISRTSGTPRGR